MEEDLAIDLMVLQSHLDGMIDQFAKHNSASRRYRDFEMGLLSLASITDIVDHLLDDAGKYLELGWVGLSLVDETGELEKMLEDAGLDTASRAGLLLLKSKQTLQQLFGFAILPFFGAFQKTMVPEFFSESDRQPASVALIPLYRRGKYLGAVNLGSSRQDGFDSTAIKEYIVHLGTIISICLENSLNFETIKRTSFIDILTGVNNRRFFEQRFVVELDRCQRNNDAISLLFLDIDFFKSINDQYGHQTGDHVLALVAKAIKSQLRNNDVLARYGGEEFVALLSNIDRNKAFEIAERIRKTVESLEIPFQENCLTITVSIGLSTHYPDKNTITRAADATNWLISSADAALYEAKRNGRNRVETGIGLVA